MPKKVIKIQEAWLSVLQKSLTVNYNDVVEMVFQVTKVGVADNHPTHLHGFSFYVIGMGWASEQWNVAYY